MNVCVCDCIQIYIILIYIFFFTVNMSDKFKLGKLVNEGKTKKVYELLTDPSLCLLISKDRITAGDGVKAHDLEGKAEISTTTTVKVFKLLSEVGLKTAFVKPGTEKSFVAKKCDMIPIEWVTRRVATGSFLKRHPGMFEHKLSFVGSIRNC